MCKRGSWKYYFYMRNIEKKSKCDSFTEGFFKTVMVKWIMGYFSVIPDVVVFVAVTPWTVPHQTPLSMEFSRQEYWSGLPFPSPGDLPNPGIESGSPELQADSLPSEPQGKTYKWWYSAKFIDTDRSQSFIEWQANSFEIAIIMW